MDDLIEELREIRAKLISQEEVNRALDRKGFIRCFYRGCPNRPAGLYFGRCYCDVHISFGIRLEELEWLIAVLKRN